MSGLKIKDGGSAFPQYERMDGGMTLRDYIATHSLPWVAGLNSIDGKPVTFANLASVAYELADEMLKARQS